MKKSIYEAPSTKILEIRVKGTILQASSQAMNYVAGSWDDEED